MHILILVSWYKTSENKIAGSFFEEYARHCSYSIVQKRYYGWILMDSCLE
jgi:hypothetical protein